MEVIYDGEYIKFCQELNYVKNHMAALIVLKELNRYTSAYSRKGDVSSFTPKDIMEDIDNIIRNFLTPENFTGVRYIVIGAFSIALSEKDKGADGIYETLDSIQYFSNAKSHLTSAIIRAQHLIRQEIATDLFRTSNLWMKE